MLPVSCCCCCCTWECSTHDVSMSFAIQDYRPWRCNTARVAWLFLATLRKMSHVATCDCSLRSTQTYISPGPRVRAFSTPDLVLKTPVCWSLQPIFFLTLKELVHARQLLAEQRCRLMDSAVAWLVSDRIDASRKWHGLFRRTDQRITLRHTRKDKFFFVSTVNLDASVITHSSKLFRLEEMHWIRTRSMISHHLKIGIGRRTNAARQFDSLPLIKLRCPEMCMVTQFCSRSFTFPWLLFPFQVPPIPIITVHPQFPFFPCRTFLCTPLVRR